MKTINSIRFFRSAGSTPWSSFFSQEFSSLIPSLLNALLVTCALCFGLMSSASARTIFVNANSQGSSAIDGSSWSLALLTIEGGILKAIEAATQAPGTAINIWVAGGNYPMTYCNRSLPNNVTIYGGFAGTENDVSQRPFTGNLPTIQTVLTEPLFSTCYLFRLTETTNTFNGVTLMATGGIMQKGGSLTAVSSTFTGNPASYGVAGGAGINAHSGATLLVDKSLFANLKASVGGAIAGLNAASITVTNSTFSGNQALGMFYSDPTTGAAVFHSGGGAINVDGNFSYYYYNFGVPVNNTQVTLGGNTFINNSQWGHAGGGAIHVEDADTVTVTNSIFGALDSNGLPILSSRNSASYYDYRGANGGAISLSSSNRITVNRNNFYGNAASLGGGAIHSQAQNVNGSVSITANRFIQNSAVSGGAIADVSEISNDGFKTVTLNISSNIFNSNIASKGPAFFYDTTQAKINSKTTVQAINNALRNDNPTLRPSDISP